MKGREKEVGGKMGEKEEMKERGGTKLGRMSRIKLCLRLMSV